MAVSGNYTAIVQVKVSDTELQKQLQTVGSKTTVNVKVNADTSQIEKLKTTVNSTSKEIKDYASSSSTASQANEKISVSADKASKSTKSLGADFVDTTLKVAKFGASTAVIGVFYSAIQEAKEQVTIFDNSLAELMKVTDLSGDSLSNFKDEAFDLAEQLSTTASNVMDATTEFSKSGFSLEDSKTMAEQALIFKTVADGEISAADAATTLIQVTKAYNMTAEESQHIVDSFYKKLGELKQG